MGAGASASLAERLNQASVGEIQKVCATLDAGVRERLAQVLSKPAKNVLAGIVKKNGNKKIQRILGDGDVRLVMSLWLVSTPKEWLLQRMQDLPPEALADPDKAACMFKKSVHNNLTRANLIQEVFEALDGDEDGYLNQHEMRQLAEHIGFVFDDSEWAEHYSLLCSSSSNGAQSGISFDRFQDLVEDQGDEGLYCTDDELRAILAAGERASPQEAPAGEDDSSGDGGGPITIVSYAWLSKSHPDPTRFHLKRLKWYLPLVGLEALFMDFLSLPQVDAAGVRSDMELKAFKNGLGIINYLYGSEHTMVVQLTAMPGAGMAFEGMNAVPYSKRGWCRFEEITSSIMKSSKLLMDVGRVEDDIPFDDEDKDLFSDMNNARHQEVVLKMMGSAKPPVCPKRMEQILKDSIFTNGSDVGKVANMYEIFFNHVGQTADKLDFSQFKQSRVRVVEGKKVKYTPPAWSEDVIAALAEALPAFTACKKLFLSPGPLSPGEVDRYHTAQLLGDAGIRRLAEGMAGMPSLEELCLTRCKFGEDGLSVLQSALVSSSSPLQKLALPDEPFLQVIEGEFDDWGGPSWGLSPAAQSMKEAWLAAGKADDDLFWGDNPGDDSD